METKDPGSATTVGEFINLWTPAPDERALLKARKERYKLWTDTVEQELAAEFERGDIDYTHVEQLLHCRLMLMQTVP